MNTQDQDRYIKPVVIHFKSYSSHLIGIYTTINLSIIVICLKEYL